MIIVHVDLRWFSRFSRAIDEFIVIAVENECEDHFDLQFGDFYP